MSAPSGDERIDWAALVALLLPPLKVSILEALTYVDRPLSALDLQELVGADEGAGQPTVEEHLRQFVEAGALDSTRERQGAGASEVLFFFPAPTP